MTQQEFIRHLSFKPIKGYESIQESIIEIAKSAYDAGFKEGMDTTNEIYTKTQELLSSKIL